MVNEDIREKKGNFGFTRRRTRVLARATSTLVCFERYHGEAVSPSPYLLNKNIGSAYREPNPRILSDVNSLTHRAVRSNSERRKSLTAGRRTSLQY